MLRSQSLWRRWQQLLVGLALGGLLSYLALWRSGHPAAAPARLWPGGAVSQNSNNMVCALPRAVGLALSPMALANVTGNPHLIPDRLIVVARHREAPPALARLPGPGALELLRAGLGPTGMPRAQDTAWLDVYLSHIPHIGEPPLPLAGCQPAWAGARSVGRVLQCTR